MSASLRACPLARHQARGRRRSHRRGGPRARRGLRRGRRPSVSSSTARTTPPRRYRPAPRASASRRVWATSLTCAGACCPSHRPRPNRRRGSSTTASIAAAAEAPCAACVAGAPTPPWPREPAISFRRADTRDERAHARRHGPRGGGEAGRASRAATSRRLTHRASLADGHDLSSAFPRRSGRELLLALVDEAAHLDDRGLLVEAPVGQSTAAPLPDPGAGAALDPRRAHSALDLASMRVAPLRRRSRVRVPSLPARRSRPRVGPFSWAAPRHVHDHAGTRSAVSGPGRARTPRQPRRRARRRAPPGRAARRRRPRRRGGPRAHRGGPLPERRRSGQTDADPTLKPSLERSITWAPVSLRGTGLAPRPPPDCSSRGRPASAGGVAKILQVRWRRPPRAAPNQRSTTKLPCRNRGVRRPSSERCGTRDGRHAARRHLGRVGGRLPRLIPTAGEVIRYRNPYRTQPPSRGIGGPLSRLCADDRSRLRRCGRLSER